MEITANPLESPESDEAIQENPRKSEPESKEIQEHFQGIPRENKHFKIVVVGHAGASCAGEANEAIRLLGGGPRVSD